MANAIPESPQKRFNPGAENWFYAQARQGRDNCRKQAEWWHARFATEISRLRLGPSPPSVSRQVVLTEVTSNPAATNWSNRAMRDLFRVLLSSWLEQTATRMEERIERGAETSSDDIKALNSFYYDVAMMKLNNQLDEIKTIDTRTTSYFTIGSAVLPIVAGFLTTDRSQFGDSAVATYALFAGFAAYLALALFYVWSFRYTGWDTRPEVEQWKKVTTEFAVEDLQRWLGDACVEAYKNNEPRIEQKAGKSAWALWGLAGEVVFLSVAVLAPLWPF